MGNSCHCHSLRIGSYDVDSTLDSLAVSMEKIDVRFGELLIPQDVIRIDSRVREIAELACGLPEQEAVYQLWDYVCRKIDYPDGSPWLPLDRHVLHAFPVADLPFFGLRYRLVRSNDEFWEYPSEALDWGVANCEGSSIALCALLRAYGVPPERAFVAVGEVPGGHAWVVYNDGTGERILETTLRSAPPDPWRTYSDYRELWRFNDMIRIGDIQLVPKRDELAKLKRLGVLWSHETKA